MILERINTPSDLKKISVAEMNELAAEIRDLIIKRVNTIGGHLAPNLGIVDATIALHYVFNSPIDKIIYDVAHQCYCHKILTGRKDGFTDPCNYLKYTRKSIKEVGESVGFPQRKYFAKVFKSVFSVTPTQYREEN